MFRNTILFLGLLLGTTLSASAQLGKIPVSVTAAFSKQYATATQVSYSDNLGDYTVSFRLDTTAMVARYNGKGVWKGSERSIAFETLSADVKDGFMKSKFSDWNVLGVLQLYLPESQGGGEQFRVKVGKGDLKKRYLYFNRSGKLVRDKMTL